MVDAPVFDAVQLRPAPDTAGHPAGRERDLTLEQVTLVTGYDGCRTVHEFTCSILAICVPTSLNVSFQVVTQQELTGLRYVMVCEAKYQGMLVLCEMSWMLTGGLNL